MLKTLVKIAQKINDSYINEVVNNDKLVLQQIFQYCKNIRYGVYDYLDNQPHFYTENQLTDQVFYNKWRLLTPQQIQKYNSAICWDMSNFCKILLQEKLNIKNVQLYCQLDNEEKASHSFNIVKIQQLFYIFDCAWKRYSNLNFASDTIQGCIKQMAKRMFEQHPNTQNIVFYQIVNKAEYGCNCIDYMQNIYNNNKFLVSYNKEQIIG